MCHSRIQESSQEEKQGAQDESASTLVYSFIDGLSVLHLGYNFHKVLAVKKKGAITQMTLAGTEKHYVFLRHITLPCPFCLRVPSRIWNLSFNYRRDSKINWKAGCGDLPEKYNFICLTCNHSNILLKDLTRQDDVCGFFYTNVSEGSHNVFWMSNIKNWTERSKRIKRTSCWELAVITGLMLMLEGNHKLKLSWHYSNSFNQLKNDFGTDVMFASCVRYTHRTIYKVWIVPMISPSVTPPLHQPFFFFPISHDCKWVGFSDSVMAGLHKRDMY